ncbi:hypothetical protein [Rhizobium sp. P32RR-XVIII]|uniref:hypothetical protein n=1 Tax=Rhizobium sp. P32RR-XVIII TaxID=2726738 RepID=UPI001FEF5F2A
MSVLHKMATGLIALTLTASSLTTATPAHADSDDFWGGVAAGAIGGILLSTAVRPGYYPAYGGYGGYAGYGGYGGYGVYGGYGGYYRPYYYRPYAYNRPYYRPYYNSYYRPYYYRPYHRPYYRSYYRPYGGYYRNYGYCGVERRYDHRSDVWVNVRVCPRY